MMLRSFAIAALMLAGSGVACAQSVYLYVAPGASVYVTPPTNAPYYNGATAVYPELYPGPYAPPVPVIAAPVYGPAAIAPQVYVAPASTYAPTYDAPLQAYGATPSIIMQRRVGVEAAPRPSAPVHNRRR